MIQKMSRLDRKNRMILLDQHGLKMLIVNNVMVAKSNASNVMGKVSVKNV